MAEGINNLQNSFGTINRVGYTENGRAIYSLVDGKGSVAGKLTIPQDQCDVFEKSYQDIKDEFIPLLIDKTKAQIDSYNTVDEMKTEGALSQTLYDSFTGASVSTNNMLRMLQALMNYHVENYVNK